MNFFNTNTAKTYTISTTKSNFVFTAQDIAKVVAFGERYITWSGPETWVSAVAVADMLALFCTEEGMERGHLREALRSKADTSFTSSDTDEAFRSIIADAQNILAEWGSAKLYTCLTKSAEGNQERRLNLDKLEAKLGIELGDEVRERLSLVTAAVGDDGEWVFDGAAGRSFRDTATIGVLTEIRDAVQLLPTMLAHCIDYVKQGYKTFEEIAEASYSIHLDRWTQADIDSVKAALAEANVQPDRYAVYVSKCNRFSIGVAQEVAGLWDFIEQVHEFATKQEAEEFCSTANENFSIEKKRQQLAVNIADATEQLEQLKAELEALYS